ncbi:shikimate dehydrogenase [Roseivirga seohaensis subsp. aquiponti]|uniref:Shikimate dehydrogenase n=1 Tax=Roseivirga seohaensis subsp. aquiponti TaxID=1566026 RepID=A0A0L8ANY1_9BACT|nr:shikimate dehydrogenase [Roseivirga seohaensis]KOF03956.1 shikimate dehydrogenase [Roseivirga seohaensis subsp. aquiponti]
MRKFGLIGYPLGHSFSKKHFSDKFEKEGIKAEYELYPLEDIEEFPALVKNTKGLEGINVTIPYKESVMKFLDEIDEKAAAIGAVNTIKIQNGKLKGFNTDYLGFKTSLVKFIGANPMPENALILGTGGASKAVQTTLSDLDIQFKLVSRNPQTDELSYQDFSTSTPQHSNTLTPQHLNTYQLIINTTPLGMAPKTDELPDLPYQQLTSDHFLYDLVYNPLVTAFMQKGIEAKCWVKNGLEMLHGQAEAAWEIWNE